MEVDSAFSIYYFSSLSLLVTLFITTLFCFSSLFAFRFSPLQKSKPIQSSDASVSDPNSFHKTCNCKCSCHRCNSGGGEVAVVVAKADRQTGASMMEQLVPEVTTHALSYLDYLSLCRLSMTNSLMRKAANDDNAWKSLYHKDFTLEQDSITPVKGWKAYYAATRAILNINTNFYNIIRERSLSAMGDLWLNADYVKCIHASGEYFTGYKAVMESWQLCFNWEHGVDFQIQDVWARVLTDMAWVTMKTYIVDEETVSFKVTHVFEFHNERWYMVHHHSFPM